MSELFSSLSSAFDQDQLQWVKVMVLGYFGLLWLSIIIWVTRDALARSNNIFFQMIAILINIALPILGVIIYLIIRPSKTHLERYYEEAETDLLEGEEEGMHASMCEKCMIKIEKEYIFCPNCGTKQKKNCHECKKNFSNIWQFCPFCGIEYKEKTEKSEKTRKTFVKHPIAEQ